LDTAQEAGVDGDQARIVARAISSHVSVTPCDDLGYYIQAGSMLDIIGKRVWHLDRASVLQVCRTRSRIDFPGECHSHRPQWALECKAFRNGRAAYARRPGGLVVVSHLPLLPA